MTNISIFTGIITLCVLWGIFPPAGAVVAEDEQEGWGIEQGNDIPLIDDEQEKEIDKAKKLASEQVLAAANWIDSFFDDGRSAIEENTTRATLNLSLGYSRYEDLEIKPRFDLRLRLPKLSSRAHLFLEASDKSNFSLKDNPLDDRLANDNGNNNELLGGLRYFLKESREYNISFDTGASWNYLFASARFRSLQNFGDWQGRFTNRLRYYTDDGFENRTSYDMEKRLSEAWFFRVTTSAGWNEGQKGIPLSQTFSLFHVLSRYQTLAYEWSSYFTTEPSYKLTDSQLVVKYRQRFFRDWLFFEITPKLTFPEEHEREAYPSIVFKLEAALGYKSDEDVYNKVFR